MASGIINDFLQESLSHLEAQSTQVLNELAELHIHDSTIPILTPLSADSDGVNNNRPQSPQLDNPEVQDAVNKLEVVQSSFSEISALVMELKNPSTSSQSSVKLNSKTIGLKKVTKLLEPFKNGSVVKSVSSQLQTSSAAGVISVQELKIVTKLEELISLYALVALYQVILTNLLKSTLPLSDDLLYWELTSSTSWRILLYSLQTLPLRTESLAAHVFEDFKAAAAPNVESLNISIPQFITTNFPGFQNTYKLFIHYKNLIVNSFYNNLIANNVKGFYKLLGSRNRQHVGLLGHRRMKPTIKNYLNVLLGAPFNSIVQELENKKETARTLHDQNAKDLGSLLRTVPNFKESKPDSQRVEDGIKDLQSYLSSSTTVSNDIFTGLYELSSTIIPESKTSLSSKTTSFKKPSFLVRYWPILLAALLYGPRTVASAVANREAVILFIQKNVIDTISGFWNNWILKPVNNILSTIRHDDNSEISIMSQKSLDSDLDSLKRMVIEYTIENSPEYKGMKSTDIELLKHELDTMVSSGDLTPMMKGYEEDIKKPIKNLVSGRLPRALLIQLQKTKVDGAVAISGIDKLLKSQELVFGIVAASPSFVILVYVLGAVNAYVKKGYIARGTGENKLIVSRNLNNIERLLGSLEGVETDQLDLLNGQLLLEIISLRNAGLLLVPSNRRSEWVRDINDLVDSKAPTKARLHTITRMYHVYGSFFS
ncbi:CYFA0S06e04962g1_1 [Cyberlindnera fabianii]|uniref:CYFA0S06e04962g1_1 n=1 Tax=Cyberlindnera fabianii TaxID=36022 RepID=A0A061AVP6_CYBFA|nr:Nuclear control of ATPase protein 2 [Cyberlindnera fabianii]CDR41255.1 CYFA0S06e04962g1_1 [Cyberlindnera fabianii]